MVQPYQKSFVPRGSRQFVQDNLSAHKPSALYEILSPERARAILKRLEIVHTPTHGSWLNVAEIELSVLGRQALARRIGDEDELRLVSAGWSSERTEAQKGVDWQFTTADARVASAGMAQSRSTSTRSKPSSSRSKAPAKSRA